ncbi:MAG: transposase, partial [Anaerolineaceae bacterium]
GRQDTRAGHYPRKLLTGVGEVELEVPKLRTLTFETAIIQRYQPQVVTLRILMTIRDSRILKCTMVRHACPCRYEPPSRSQYPRNSSYCPC